jgi:hypothetical protein
MAEDRRENPLWVVARAGEFICMTQSSCLDFNKHLSGARAFEVHFHNFQWFSGGNSHGSTGAHHLLIPFAIWRQVPPIQALDQAYART